jgi:hypothetical protein
LFRAVNLRLARGELRPRLAFAFANYQTEASWGAGGADQCGLLKVPIGCWGRSPRERATGDAIRSSGSDTRWSLEIRRPWEPSWHHSWSRG